jgi:DNA-binding XRE family transcriptional regulator
MIPAYNVIYLNRAARAVGNMLHDAVLVFGLEGDGFLQQFIQSGVASQIENGNPKYIAGKSGFELFAEVMELTTGQTVAPVCIENYERSDVYWVGWILTHEQWHSGKSFQDILEVISCQELLGLYDILHEADVQKAYEVLDKHFASCESKLKAVRKRCGITQEELSRLSGVSLNTIRAYERRAKDLNKAQADIVGRLAGAMHCELTDLLD